MGMLSFFPWLSLRDPIAIGDYELLCWPDHLEDDPRLPKINRVLQSYYDGEHPVSRATILRYQGRPVDVDLSAEERGAAFLFAECLALAGLAARRYFTAIYQNRDNFRLVIQRFSGDTDVVVVGARRRDGFSRNMCSGSGTRFPKPEHIPGGTTHAVDVPLLAALQDLQARPEWGQIYEAMVGFNLANSDSGDMRESVEGVLMIGALQQLLGCSRTNEDGLAVALTNALEPLHDRAPGGVPHLAARAAALRNPATIREMWIRDFYRLRNALAHGRIERRSRQPVWSLRNHLLLGAYTFPLVVKKVAERAGAFRPTQEDVISGDLFELLASEDHFAPVSQPNDPGSHPWTQCMSQHLRFAIERGLTGGQGLAESVNPADG
jgi:hypothetical protein